MGINGTYHGLGNTISSIITQDSAKTREKTFESFLKIHFPSYKPCIKTIKYALKAKRGDGPLKLAASYLASAIRKVPRKAFVKTAVVWTSDLGLDMGPIQEFMFVLLLSLAADQLLNSISEELFGGNVKATIHNLFKTMYKHAPGLNEWIDSMRS